MNLETIEDQIIKKNIIQKLLSPNKDSFPLGDFREYKEIPLGWTNNLNIHLFKKKYERFNKYKSFVFIGMGGSISMPKIASFIDPHKIKIVDSFDISYLKKMKAYLNNRSTAVFICSKSGTTTETNILNNLLCEKKEDKYLISDNYKEGFLEKDILYTPKNIGGRFSLSTHFGILPFSLIGFDLKKIISEINSANKICKQNTKENPAIKIASILYCNFLNEKKVFGIKSKSKKDNISDWIEQIISESTGKLETGILPIKNLIRSTPLLSFTERKNIFKKENINLNISYDETLFHSLQIFLYAISFFCTLIKIQPFDQPNVELTKSISKKLIEEKKILFIDQKEILNISKLEELITIKNKNLITLLIHSTNLNNILKENIEMLINKISDKKTKILVHFGPNYLHSVGQLLKGSFKNIENFIINLHGNEDLNVPKSLYTLNTFVKNQGFSDYLALKSNNRNAYYFETDYKELENSLKRVINDRQ